MSFKRKEKLVSILSFLLILTSVSTGLAGDGPGRDVGIVINDKSFDVTFGDGRFILAPLSFYDDLDHDVISVQNLFEMPSLPFSTLMRFKKNLEIYRVMIDDNYLEVEFQDRRIVLVPLNFYSSLRGATFEERQDFSFFTGKGSSIVFHALNKEIVVEDMFRGYYRADEFDCSVYTWASNTVGDVGQLATEWGEEFLTHRCGREGKSFLQVAVQVNSDVRVIDALLELGFLVGDETQRGCDAICFAEDWNNRAIIPRLYEVANEEGANSRWAMYLNVLQFGPRSIESETYTDRDGGGSLQRAEGGPAADLHMPVMGGIGASYGPLSFGASYFFQVKEGDLPDGSKKGSFAGLNRTPSFTSDVLSFNTRFDILNSTRFTPFVEYGIGRRFFKVSDKDLDELNPDDRVRVIYRGGATHTHFAGGLNIALGTYPTPRFLFPSELSIGVRHTKGGSASDGTHRFSFDGNTALTLGLRVHTSNWRWRWW